MAKPFAWALPKKLRAMIEFAPKKLPPISPNDTPQTFWAKTLSKTPGKPVKRVALMTGCAQRALNTDINDATIRILNRRGCEVVVAKGAGCCGALTHHMGKTGESHDTAAKNIKAWVAEMDGEGLDAIVINASGCGTTLKDYGHMFKETPLAQDAARVAAISRDISEVMTDLGLQDTGKAAGLKVAYHAACSLPRGQKITTHPKNLLRATGFEVVEPAEAHLCCGSAGTYNLMQPEISGQLKTRKIAHLEATKPEIIASGNIGCMMQIGSGTGVPVVHTIELLDWASGGPKPPTLRDLSVPEKTISQRETA